MPRLLLVEDDADVALVTEAALVEAGLQTTVAYTVADAIALVASGEHYDLALVDYLPGIEFIRALREGLAPALPVAVYSVHDDPEYQAESERLGAVAFLSKSLPPDELAEEIMRALAPAKAR